MITLKCLNAMSLKVRDLKASLAWYREHFGFGEKYAERKAEGLR